MPRVAMIGSGSLATATAYALATNESAAGELVVVARRLEAAVQLCTIANVKSVHAGRRIRFRPEQGEIDATNLDQLFAAIRPDGVLLCASHQSPWERRMAPSAWTRLLDRAGFGATLPLQAGFAEVVGRAAARTGAWFINACLPDLVNPLLHELGVPVRCGVGNIATLAAAAQQALDCPDPGRLAMLAHHAHLHAPPPEVPEALLWRDGQPVPEVGRLLRPVRTVDRAVLNQVTGDTAARTVAAMLSGDPLDTHLPGVLGLPGGYPVRLHQRSVQLRLPDGLGVDEAIALNQAWSRHDGAVVSGGRVILGEPAAIALGAHLPHLTGGFPVADTAQVCTDLLDLRERLRSQPADSDPGGGTRDGVRRNREPARGLLSAVSRGDRPDR